MPRPLQVDLCTFDLESGIRVTCDVAYLCANFSPSIGLSVLDLGPMYVTDRQTSDARRAASLNAPYPRGGDIIMSQCLVLRTSATMSPSRQTSHAQNTANDNVQHLFFRIRQSVEKKNYYFMQGFPYGHRKIQYFSGT